MNRKISAVIIWTTFVAVLFIAVGCRKHRMDDMDMHEKNISYPAAYVVNGESNNISVIRLSSNSLSENIDLLGNGHAGNKAMYPHHIYHHANANMHRLAVAIPGIDLSGGHTGAMAGMKGRVLLIDAVKGNTIKEFEVSAMNHNVIFSPDGTEIWTSQMEMNGKILVFNAFTYSLKHTIPVGQMPAEITFSADGSKAYAANGGSDNVTIIDPVSKSVIATVPVGRNPVAAWVGFDGNMYVDNEEGKTVSVIDVVSNAVIQTIALGFMPGSVAHNPFKKELWVSDPHNAKVHYWNFNTTSRLWVKVSSFTAGAGAHAIAFTNDGNIAYVTNQLANTVSIIDASSHLKITDVAVGKKPNGIVIRY